MGILIGAMLPFYFSALTIRSVGQAAFDMVNEVRRQFKSIKGIMTGKAEPDYNRCIHISTHAALRQMIMPGLVALLVPLLVGILFGAEAVGGLLIGALVSGIALAIMLANTGGSWDNSKKLIEEGKVKGKQWKEVHDAAVIADTVGDPFKDTSGPALNILIKLMSIVALIFVTLFMNPVF
jgi:K(+)-stimulated pyrophosphate-energized sodium pump